MSKNIKKNNVLTHIYNTYRNSYLWMLKLLPDSAWLFRFLSNVSVAVLMRGTICKDIRISKHHKTRTKNLDHS